MMLSCRVAIAQLTAAPLFLYLYRSRYSAPIKVPMSLMQCNDLSFSLPLYMRARASSSIVIVAGSRLIDRARFEFSRRSFRSDAIAPREQRCVRIYN